MVRVQNDVMESTIRVFNHWKMEECYCVVLLLLLLEVVVEAAVVAWLVGCFGVLGLVDCYCCCWLLLSVSFRLFICVGFFL